MKVASGRRGESRSRWEIGEIGLFVAGGGSGGDGGVIGSAAGADPERTGEKPWGWSSHSSSECTNGQ